jgi:hypothetical protein
MIELPPIYEIPNCFFTSGLISYYRYLHFTILTTKFLTMMRRITEFVKNDNNGLSSMQEILE